MSGPYPILSLAVISKISSYGASKVVTMYLVDLPHPQRLVLSSPTNLHWLVLPSELLGAPPEELYGW